MRIAVDAREAQSPIPTGKGVWARCVIEELESRGVEFVRMDAHSAASGVWWHVRTAWKLRTDRSATLYFSPTSFIVPWLLGRSVPCAVVIHDLIAFHRDSHDFKARWIERLLLPRVLRTARHIFAVSASTKKELLERFPWVEEQKVVVVYAGPTRWKECSMASQDVQESSTTQRNTVLCIATLCPRKNQLRLIQAWGMLPADLRDEYTLILVGGRGWQDDAIVDLASKSQGVEWKGYVRDEYMYEHFRHATIFAYPSLYEGFGIPVLDAMYTGVPVLTSSRGSLAEVVSDAAYTIDPERTESIAKGLQELLTNQALQDRLRVAGYQQAQKFTWKQTAEHILDTIGS